MSLLITGLVIFVGIHLLPTFTGIRKGLINLLGEWPYKGVFAVIALTGLVLVVLGKGAAESVLIWVPPGWGKQATYLLMPVAFILLAAAYIPNNLKRVTRHPMLWGVTLWSVAHLLTNADLASLVIFATIGTFCLVDMLSANLRGAKKPAMKYTHFLDVLVIIVGLAVYGFTLTLHPDGPLLRLLG